MSGWRKRQVIEHMWKVASNNPNHDTNWHDPVVEHFAELVREDEREACAKLCEDAPEPDGRDLAERIRARGGQA
jgi:hypothetical protein